MRIYFLFILLVVQNICFGQLNIPCDNWLHLPSYQSYVSVGDLDVSGNKITVEATFSRTVPYSNGYIWAGDLVSKHNDPTDINYLLRPNDAEITTTNGYFITPPICEIELNKTYHAAMVYDGSSLKFYRNGFLMSSVPATGNLYQNDYQTRIGLYDALLYNTNLIGYINEVRIWNVARTQSEIRTYMNTSLPSPTTQPGLLAYYTFDNLLNKQGNATWNGTLGGAASINSTIPTCTFNADSCYVPTCNTNNDYSFKNDACNPLLINFHTNATGFYNIKWDFGDGTIITNQTSPSHTYQTEGTYQVTMFQEYDNCKDTVKKQIAVATAFNNQLILTPDITICKGNQIQLQTSPSINFCWSPVTNLDNPALPNPTSSTTNGITYHFTGEIWENNLITNGDFSSGNTGFSSDYNFAPQNISTGEYFIGNNPPSWNAGFSNCTDHSSGTGNMMLINGTSSTDENIWSQTIAVAPQTNFAFSTWIQSLTATNPVQLIFSINGNEIGTIMAASSPTCQWNQFYTNWNSGTATTALLSIKSKNPNGQISNYALDDIVFSPFSIQKDSIVISIDNPVVQTNNDTTICKGNSVQLNTTGADNYAWQPVTGLNNPNIGDPIATPDISTEYIVTGTTLSGCTDKDTVLITIDNPVVQTNNDTTICKGNSLQLNTIGANSYSWQPITGLSDPNIGNPVATPILNTEYIVTGTSSLGCADKDTVLIAIDDPVVQTNNDTTICKGSSIQLNTSGAASYSWQPVTGLSNPNIGNPMATPDVNTTYIVTGSSVWGCMATDTIEINILPLPVIIKSNDTTICVSGSVQLFAGGGQFYSWSPTAYLNNSTIPNPVATPPDKITYTVTVTDMNTCQNTDSIKVDVKSPNNFKIEPVDPVCANTPVQLQAIGGDTYAWQPAGTVSDSTIANPIAFPTQTTTYKVLLSDTSCHFSNTLSTLVTVWPLPNVVAQKDFDLDCSNTQSQLAASGALQYSWTPITSLNNPTIASPIAKPTITTQYIVKGIDVNGCMNYDTVTVKVDDVLNANYLMPNAFTPNNDGKNDCFGVKYWGRILQFEFSIFNRWGERIFYTQNPDDCWDGTYKNMAQDPGVYIYTIKAKTVCVNEIFRKGTFTLIR